MTKKAQRPEGCNPMKKSLFLPLLLVLIATFALAQIYQWVDKEGKVHFGDVPPEGSEVEEVVLPEGPSDEEVEAAWEKLLIMLESRKAREAAAASKNESDLIEDQRKEEREADRLKQCVNAIYHLELLSQKRRVFKFQADGSRLYLENANRPDEINRFTLLKDEYCSTHPSAQKKQSMRANEIGVALSRRCAAARETLEKMQRAGANPHEDKMAGHIMYVEAFCPIIETDDLWLGDWILINKRR